MKSYIIVLLATFYIFIVVSSNKIKRAPAFHCGHCIHDTKKLCKSPEVCSTKVGNENCIKSSYCSWTFTKPVRDPINGPGVCSDNTKCSKKCGWIKKSKKCEEKK